MRRGFTLIETLLSSTLLCMVLLLMFNLFPTSMVAIRKGEHMLGAGALARRILETKRAGAFSTLTTAPALSPMTMEDGTVLTPTYECSDQGPRLRRIRVTVSWTELETPRTLVKELWICDVKR